MTSEKKKTHIIRNNLYAFNLMKEICPSQITHGLIQTFLSYFEWLFFSAFFMRVVVDGLENSRGFWYITTFILITSGVELLMTIYFSYLNQKKYILNGITVNRALFKKLFRKARNVELGCFENAEFYNKYTLAMDKADTRLIETVGGIGGVIFGGIASVFAFYFMYEIDPVSLLFLIFPIIGNFGFNRVLNKLDYNRNKDMTPYVRRQTYINRVMYMKEYSKELRLTDAPVMLKKHYDESIDGMVNVTKKYMWKGMIFHYLNVFFTYSIEFEGLLFYGAYRALVTKSLSLAQLSVITSLMVSTTFILMDFADAIMKSIKNGIYINNLKDFLEYEEKIPEDEEGIDAPTDIESIEFRNVSFSYGEDEVIKNLSFTLEKGKNYALVGYNGAGKSTILKLLMRFYDPSKGEILLNGRNIKEYRLRSYRDMFGTAFQEQKVFSASIRENVLMRPSQKDCAEDIEKVTNALKLSGVYDRVCELPDGIDTILTKEFDKDGAVLSGGEQQKIVVARAFVKVCPVKIFDEPSSALDPIAEMTIFDNIVENGKNKTMIFVSHRLSSVQNADKVFLLEDGSIKEEGTHDELMALDGIYTSMYIKQAINYLAIVPEGMEGRVSD